LAAWHRRLPCCVQSSAIGLFVGGGHMMFRQALTSVVIKWHRRAAFLHIANRHTSPKRFSRFVGFIVQ
jgi:hypothetical protein